MSFDYPTPASTEAFQSPCRGSVRWLFREASVRVFLMPKYIAHFLVVEWSVWEVNPGNWKPKARL